MTFAIAKASALPASRPTDSFSRKLSQAFRRAAAKMRSITTDAEIMRGLEARNATAIVTDARWRTIDAELLVDLDEALRVRVGSAGDDELQRVVRTFGARKASPIRARFNLRNPFSEAFVRRRGAELVAGISEKARQQIREAIEAGFVQGVTVQATAREIRASIGLDERSARAVRRRSQALAEAGIDDDRASALTDKYADRLLAHRATMIARTETISASNQGLQDSWRQAKDEGLMPPGMLKRWIAALGSERTCPICEELGEHEPVPIDQEFYSQELGTGIMSPTAHPGCRCTLGLVRPT